jgi:DNA polymerase delta subunit 3
MKQAYDNITSIHIYSLSPGTIPDLMALTDLTRGLYADVFAKEDPLLHSKTYGVIQNKNVRRRKGKRPLIPAPQPTKPVPTAKTNAQPPTTGKTSDDPKPAAKAGTVAAGFKSTPALKKEDTASRPSSRDSTSTSASKPALKRDASDIFKAFAKGATKSKAKTANATTKDADTPMSGLNDDDDDAGEGESEEEALFLDTGNKQAAKKRASEVKQERADKAAKLRKMMDSDDEAEAAAASVAKTEDGAGPAKDELPSPSSKAAKTEGEGEDDVAWSDSDTETKHPSNPAVGAQSQEEQAAEEEEEGKKRRRGKRKVTKKRTMKDADGYLVTKEEDAWESFSETDEEPSLSQKQKQTAGIGSGGRAGFGGFAKAGGSQAAKSGAKGPDGKKTAGGGKKDIMSFFGKK